MIKKIVLLSLKTIRSALIVVLCLEGILLVGGIIYNLINPNTKNVSQLDFAHLSLAIGLTLVFLFLVIILKKIVIKLSSGTKIRFIIKKKYCISFVIIIALLFISYFVDRKVFIHKRVLKYSFWTYCGGDKIRGNRLEIQNLYFHKDTMIFDYKSLKEDSNTGIRQRMLSVEKIDDGKYSVTETVEGEINKKQIIDVKNDSIYFEHKKQVIKAEADSLTCEYKNRDTLILKCQYFNTMKIMDPKTKKVGKYSTSQNWLDYLFFYVCE